MYFLRGGGNEQNIYKCLFNTVKLGSYIIVWEIMSRRYIIV